MALESGKLRMPWNYFHYIHILFAIAQIPRSLFLLAFLYLFRLIALYPISIPSSVFPLISPMVFFRSVSLARWLFLVSLVFFLCCFFVALLPPPPIPPCTLFAYSFLLLFASYSFSLSSLFLPLFTTSNRNKQYGSHISWYRKICFGSLIPTNCL